MKNSRFIIGLIILMIGMYITVHNQIRLNWEEPERVIYLILGLCIVFAGGKTIENSIK